MNEAAAINAIRDSHPFNRSYIFSVIDFYHDPDIWLFGGVWEVRERLTECYVVTLTDQGSSFIGRLKLHSSYKQRSTRVKLENYIEDFTATEILREKYTGRDFPGHDWIDIGFAELEALMRALLQSPAGW